MRPPVKSIGGCCTERIDRAYRFGTHAPCSPPLHDVSFLLRTSLLSQLEGGTQPMATEATAVAGAAATGRVENKGLKSNAIGYISNVVISTASVAPAYSIAATLGFIIADPGVGAHAPGVLLAAFVPMLLVSLAYRYLNKADPDAGTTFACTTRAFGPGTGWVTGWAIFLADVLVMASLGSIAAIYTFKFFGWHWAESHKGAALVGCVLWILLMTWICHRGIELSARMQQLLLSFEVLMLAIFAVVSLVDVYSGNAAAHSIEPAASTQTTILPTARTTLSMAKWGAIPPAIGRIHPRFLTPTVSTWGFGLLSIAVAVPLILISSTVLELAVVALGIPVCFYYGSTGFACAWYYRRELLRSARKFLLVGLAPVIGGAIFY